MASFSSLFTELTGAGMAYVKDGHLASRTFNQSGVALYQNNPRLPFEYYVNINLNQSTSDLVHFVSTFLTQNETKQISPLIKRIDMPSMKVQTDILNQYNRRRVSQTKVDFDSVKMVFHDVADGKTLRFWNLYYRYYFLEGGEPGVTGAKSTNLNKASSIFDYGIKLNKDLTGLPSAIGGAVGGLFGGASKSPSLPGSLLSSIGKKSANGSPNSDQDEYGSKQDTFNIVSNSLHNHNFGYNIKEVANSRQLIKSIEIVQVHGGRMNTVVLVNPRISSLNHDVLDYSATDKTLEITLTLDYEYAYYMLENEKLDEIGIEKFSRSEFLELPALSFNSRLLDFMESNNTFLQSDNPILSRIGKNVQTKLGDISGGILSNRIVRPLSSSVLNGMANISPKPVHPTSGGTPPSKSFLSSALTTATNAYNDVSRIARLPK
jgi:hypothetical protein